MKKPLRILYITHTSARGGAARSLTFLIRGFPDNAIEAYVACPPGPAVDGFRNAGAQIVAIPGISVFQSIAGAPTRGVMWLTCLRTLWYLRHGNLLREAILKIDPDVVHLNERGFIQAGIIAKRCSRPVVMHARSLSDSTSTLHRLAEKYLSTRVDWTIAIDESVKHSLHDSSRCQVIYNPMGPDEIPHEPRPTPFSKVFRAVFVSGLIYYKGIWDLLESAKLLRDRKDIIFDVYGGNPQPDKFYSSFSGRLCSALGLTSNMALEIRKWVLREGLESTVRLKGHVDDVAQIYSEANCLLFPSHLNGVGRSVFEAGVWGTPSIVTLRDRIEDIIEDGVTGLVGSERNPTELSRMILRLADDPDLTRRLGENARAKYLMRFAPERIASQMLEVYKSLA